MFEFVDSIPGIGTLKDRVLSRRKKSEVEIPPVDLSSEQVLKFINSGSEKKLEVFQNNMPEDYLDPKAVNLDLLDSLDNYSVIQLQTSPAELRSPFIVKRDGVFKTDFIEEWYVERGDFHEMQRQREKRWERLRVLGWPVMVWHGTTLDVQKSILDDKKHFLLLHETLTDSPGYANSSGEAVMGYAIPANNLTATQSLSAKKMGISTQPGPDFISKGDFKGKGERAYIDLEKSSAYDYSEELVSYLRASNIQYRTEESEGARQIFVPLLQRNYHQAGGSFSEFLFDSEDRVILHEQARSWRTDLYDPKVILFKDGVKIKVAPKKIPVPM